MKIARRLSLLLGLTIAMPAIAAPTPGAERYAMGAVKADFKARQRIGTKRAGLVCLPAGSFLWSDARAGLDNASASVATILHDAAPAVVDTADDPFSDEAGATRYKIVATIVDFQLTGCVRNWGMAARLSHKHALSGRAHLSVGWDVFDRTTRAKAEHQTIDTEFDLTSDVDDAAEALSEGLKRNAAEFAKQRLSAAPHR